MAKTGGGGGLGTAEGAVMGRAAHAIHAESPILDDSWAIRLLDPATQAQVRDPAYAERSMVWGDFDSAPLFALNVGCLRYAEDEVDRGVERGIDQYLILGAGFDTFALRRGDLRDRLQIYEVDHPDVQALKRARIAKAGASPDGMPTFVPLDFESTRLAEGLGATDFEPERPCVVSWMNTIPYLSEAATQATLRELAELMAPTSRLALNYACDVPLSETQRAYMQSLQGKVSQSGEPLRARWTPEAFEELLVGVGFRIVEHVSEQVLHSRYFEGRADGLSPGVPARLAVVMAGG